jgi:hypothetical protein
MGTRQYDEHFMPSGTFHSSAIRFKNCPYANEFAMFAAKDL